MSKGQRLRPDKRPKVLIAATTYGSVFYDKSSPLDSSGEVVGPVRNHVAMEEWEKREPDLPAVGVSVCRRISTMLVIWSVFHTKMALDTIGYQAQAARLFDDLLVIPSAEFSLVGQCPAGRECMECSLPLIRH